ncbi:MAG: glycosyltransferase [Prevotellaceae bacterium]|jgi:GT2 family glycosyltransferase|nr:glycosyltransferase [Prevotellaceae bacterium]
MTEHPFIIVVVLYKTGATESLTLISLADNLPANSKLVVWDNSPSPLHAPDLEWIHARFPNSEYIHTPENTPLAKVYNHVYGTDTQHDWFLILDQDTTLTAGFFAALRDAIARHPDVNLFVPLVCHGHQVISPADFRFFRGVYWTQRQTGRVTAPNRLAIASGMTIRMEYLKKKANRFDERLKLYGVDDKFMLDYGKENHYFVVLDYVLTHQLSMFEQEDVERKTMRFIEHKHAQKAVCKSVSIFSWAVISGYLFIKSIAWACKWKDVRIIFK